MDFLSSFGSLLVYEADILLSNLIRHTFLAILLSEGWVDLVIEVYLFGN